MELRTQYVPRAKFPGHAHGRPFRTVPILEAEPENLNIALNPSKFPIPVLSTSGTSLDARAPQNVSSSPCPPRAAKHAPPCRLLMAAKAHCSQLEQKGSLPSRDGCQLLLLKPIVSNQELRQRIQYWTPGSTPTLNLTSLKLNPKRLKAPNMKPGGSVLGVLTPLPETDQPRAVSSVPGARPSFVRTVAARDRGHWRGTGSSLDGFR